MIRFTGPYWQNVMERSFCFHHENDDDAVFVAVESQDKTAADKHIKHD